LADQFPTPEHLRKYALIRTGQYVETVYPAASKAEAERFARWFRADDEFALVHVDGCLVTVRRAKSQSKRAMGGKEFQASKTRVLDFIALLVGVTPDELRQNASAA
jgi:hypothetical protein